MTQVGKVPGIPRLLRTVPPLGKSGDSPVTTTNPWITSTSFTPPENGYNLLIDTVHSWLYRHMLHRSLSTTRRDSVTSKKGYVEPLHWAVHRQSGELCAWDTQHDLRTYLQIGLGIDWQASQWRMTAQFPETSHRLGIGAVCMLDTLSRYNHRSLIPRQALVPETTPLRPGIANHNRWIIRKIADDSAGCTISLQVNNLEHTILASVYHVDLQFDGRGALHYAALARPQVNSPRPTSTRYERGIHHQGPTVSALVNLYGVLLHHNNPAQLSDLHNAALASMWQADHAQRTAALQRHPYLVDVAHNRGCGALLNDLCSPALQLEGRFARRRALLSYTANGYRLFPADRPELHQGTYLATLTLELRQTTDYALASNTLFHWETTSGNIPAAVTTALQFAQRRAKLGSALHVPNNTAA